MSPLPVRNIKPGELHVSNSPCRIRTLLGSCVSVTVHNEQGEYGGMNHFMLPEVLPNRQKGPRDFRFGDLSIRHLIEKMLTYDPDPNHLDVNIYGGGRVVSALSDAEIGTNNVKIAKEILDEFGLCPSETVVEGNRGLKLDFNTKTNEVHLEPIGRTEDEYEVATEREQQRLSDNSSRIEDILSGSESDEGIDFLSE